MSCLPLYSHHSRQATGRTRRFSLTDTSHLLEHLTVITADAVLREAFRLLSTGGTLRVVVPDAAAWLTEYTDGLLRRAPSTKRGGAASREGAGSGVCVQGGDCSPSEGGDPSSLGRVRPSFSGGLWEGAVPRHWPWRLENRSAAQLAQRPMLRSELAWTLSYLGGQGGALKELHNAHVMGFDHEMLLESLVAAGFDRSSVRASSFGASVHAPLREVERTSNVAHAVYVDGDGGAQSTSLFMEVTK